MFNKLHKTFNKKNDKLSPIRVYHWQKEHLVHRASGKGTLECGVEIGVREGLGAELWCKHNPKLKLFCIDPWEDWPGHRDMNRLKSPSDFLEEAKQRLAIYDCEFIKAKSWDCVDQIENESLDFIYIDGDHGFDGTMLDLILWVPKVRIGGLIAGHEYKVHRYTGVIDAVNMYTKHHLIKEWYITNEMDATYFWQKEVY